MNTLAVSSLASEPICQEDTDMKLDPVDDSVDINLRVKEKDGNRIAFDSGTSGLFQLPESNRRGAENSNSEPVTWMATKAML